MMHHTRKSKMCCELWLLSSCVFFVVYHFLSSIIMCIIGGKSNKTYFSAIYYQLPTCYKNSIANMYCCTF